MGMLCSVVNMKEKINYIKRLKELEAEIKEVKTKIHNQSMLAVSKGFHEELLEKATIAELKFKHIADLKKLPLKFQYQINIVDSTGERIERFYFADFVDRRYNLIFEVDGGYHNDSAQRKRDYIRTKELQKLGYKVFRISNSDVLNGKASEFLYKAYKSIGVNI